jgi:hypothetical protein
MSTFNTEVDQVGEFFIGREQLENKGGSVGIA